VSSDFAYGLHAVHAVLVSRSEYVQEVWIQTGIHNNHIKQLVSFIEEKNVALRFVDKVRMDRKAQGKHQGVLAIVQSAPIYRENDLYTLLDTLKSTPFLLLLDGITDPHNLGACIRSADAAGVHAVIAPKDKTAPLNAVACKVSCGATEQVPFITVTNLVRTMKALQERGIWLIGTASEAKQSIYQTKIDGSVGLVMGSEDKGLRRLTREHCDELANIPMTGSVSSVNVSVATGICLFEAVRQKQFHCIR